MPEGSVAEALDDVRQAVAELQEANFDGVEGLQAAKAKISAALQSAKEAGASDAALLDAGRAQTFAVDDSVNAGVAARKARKLRMLEREYASRHRTALERGEKERLEKERASRVSERLAVRRGGPDKERLEQERAEKEKAERVREESGRAARVAQRLAERRARARAGEGGAEAAAGGGAGRDGAASTSGGAAGATKVVGADVILDVEEEDAHGRGRSRSPRRSSSSVLV